MQHKDEFLRYRKRFYAAFWLGGKRARPFGNEISHPVSDSPPRFERRAEDLPLLQKVYLLTQELFAPFLVSKVPHISF